MIRIILAILLIASPVFGQSYQPKPLGTKAAGADITLLRRGLETIHPGLYRYRSQSDIDAAFGRLEAVARQPTSDLELWRAISLMLAEIRCDHTKAEASDAIEQYRLTHATHLPLRFKVIEGRMIVVSTDGQMGAPPRGAEIIGINGTPAPVVLSRLAQAVVYDGTTDQSIAAKLSEDGDLSGDDFNEYWPIFYGFPTRWDLDWKLPGASTSSQAALTPISFQAWTALVWPGGAYRSEFYNTIKWRLTGKTAYLRIDTLVNYRNPVDATAFLGGFFKTLQAERVDHLILDLRENGGGSEDVSLALARYLLPARFTWSKPVLLKAIRYGDLPDHIASWGDRSALFEPPLNHFRKTTDGWWERLPQAGDEDDDSVLPQDVLADRFIGRLTVLTGPRNGSGATRTIAQLKEKRNAVLVGEDSGGSAEGPTAGHIFLLTLPESGLKIRIPNAWNRTDIAQFVPGRGVAVDVQVTPTLADFDADVDRALAVAKGAVDLQAPSLAGTLSGQWTGTLEYRDFGNDRRVVLPTELTATDQNGDVNLALSMDDGPGKLVRSLEHWSMGAGATLMIDGEAETIIERRGGPNEGDLTLVTRGRGQEKDVDVAVETIVTRRGATLSISRLSQRPGMPLLLRHAYVFHRVG